MLTLLRSRTLQRYVLREFGNVLCLSLLACTLFMLLATFFITASEYEEYGITLGQVALLFPYLLPRTLSFSIPPAAMIGATLVFGRLSAENEIIAAQAGGAPLRVLAAPILICGLLLSGVSLWCTQGGMHWGYSTIRYEILNLDNPETFLKKLDREGKSITLKRDGGGIAHINLLPHVHEASGHVRKPIHIAYFQDQQVGWTVLAGDHHYAPEARGDTNERILTITLMDAQVLGKDPTYWRELTTEIKLPPLDTFINIGDTRGTKGWWQNYNEGKQIKDSLRDRRRFILQRAAEFGAYAMAGGPGDLAAASLATSGYGETRTASEGIYATRGALDRIRAEYTECHRKLALSLLPLSMAMLGIGLGLLVRKSQRLVGFLLAILVYGLIYYPMVIACKELAFAGIVGLWAMWIPNIILFAAGYMLWQAFERGWLSGMPGWLAGVGPLVAGWVRDGALALWRPFLALRDWGMGRVRRKTDGYIAGSFIVPLIVIVLVMVATFTALDLVHHGGDVIEGIVKAADPQPGMPKRGQTEAILDVATYYSILALGRMADLLPLLILMAGVWCVVVMVRNNEHLILKSSGVPLQRAFRPIMLFTLGLSLTVMVFRETLMPELIMRRDELKPLVYRRGKAPTALALYTTDADGKPVLFQMSQYASMQRTGKDLRVYLLGERREDGRIPTIVADQATWSGGVWKLKINPVKDQKLKPGATPPPLLDYGYRVKAETAGGDAIPPNVVPEKSPINTQKTRLPEWKGGVTPSFIESERLGPGVMNLSELLAASEAKREYSVELWRRLSEAAMALFLLWAAVPLLLREETRRPLLGVGLSILLGAAYWSCNIGCVEAARENMLPCWAPLLPHALFLVIGFRHYYLKMET